MTSRRLLALCVCAAAAVTLLGDAVVGQFVDLAGEPRAWLMWATAAGLAALSVRTARRLWVGQHDLLGGVALALGFAGAWPLVDFGFPPWPAFVLPALPAVLLLASRHPRCRITLPAITRATLWAALPSSILSAVFLIRVTDPRAVGAAVLVVIAVTTLPRAAALFAACAAIPLHLWAWASPTFWHTGGCLVFEHPSSFYGALLAPMLGVVVAAWIPAVARFLAGRPLTT